MTTENGPGGGLKSVPREAAAAAPEPAGRTAIVRKKRVVVCTSGPPRGRGIPTWRTLEKDARRESAGKPKTELLLVTTALLAWAGPDGLRLRHLCRFANFRRAVWQAQQLAKLRLYCTARAARPRNSEAISLLVQDTAPWHSGAHRRAFKLSRATCNCSPSSPSRARDEARPQQ